MPTPFTTFVFQPKIVCNTVHHCIVGPEKSGKTTFAHQLTLDIVKQLEGDLMFLYTPEHEEDNVLQEEQQSLWTHILSIEKQYISDCWNKEQIDYLYHPLKDYILKMMCELIGKKGAKKHQIDFDKINPLEKDRNQFVRETNRLRCSKCKTLMNVQTVTHFIIT